MNHCKCTCVNCEKCDHKVKQLSPDHWQKQYESIRMAHEVSDFIPIAEKLRASVDLNTLDVPNQLDPAITIDWSKESPKLVVANMHGRRCDNVLVFTSLPYQPAKTCEEHNTSFKQALRLHNGTIREAAFPFCIRCLIDSRKYFFAKSEHIYDLSHHYIIYGDDFASPCEGPNCNLLLPEGLTYCSTTCMVSK